jgi:hypothetical protein
MASRIPPPNPESSRQSQAQKTQEARKIEKVREIDADEQARRQRFQKSMQQAEEEEDEKGFERKTATQPSPFQTAFHQERETPSSDLSSDRKIPNPSYSQPPNLDELASQKEDLMSDKELPQSREFWKQVDLPDQPYDRTPSLTSERGEVERRAHPDQERTKKAPIEREREKIDKHLGKKNHEPFSAPEQSKNVLEPSPFGPPGKLTSKKPPTKKITEEQETVRTPGSTPGAKYWELQPELEKKGKEPLPSLLDLPPEKALNQQKTEETSQGVAPLLQKPELASRDRESGHGPKATIEIVPPSLPGFSATVHPEATAAASAATPYLRPEAVPLFYQMVGTILVMTNQGISTTEILLNNPAFAGSKFFGASIEIIKYSSAPDSLNIRLSGSNEAVTAFNQSIPGLMAAFQTGGFQFRIGRIEATYAIDRPAFHRKEERQGNNSGDQSEKEKR